MKNIFRGFSHFNDFTWGCQKKHYTILNNLNIMLQLESSYTGQKLRLVFV